jgi:hypothetical protein
MSGRTHLVDAPGLSLASLLRDFPVAVLDGAAAS